ncbi:hypothetical protein SAMN04488564_119107 [Lentzea waywayandensis]|uniref:Uncharacterized protein n=1 Tax=Lentzea waywayandensis TaxID=84724 RepID=A0A1I6FHP1_9PSEU|nr:hypothetical protein [Lentzea waywayandensis]SFR29463.1 hypothetical protein SAMN04488564_119107 [Lentzea waywayandensis]
MTYPQDPWQQQNPDDVQWQNPAGAYPVAPAPAGQYQVNQVGQASFAMAPLAPVLPHEMAPPRPATITAAMWIWIAGAVLSVAVLPVMLLANADYFLGQNTSTSEQDRQAGELGVRVMAVVFGFAMLVGAAPYVAFAIVLRNGQGWARILLTILGVIGLLSMTAITLISLGARVWQPSVVISIVVMGLTIAAVVLQFLPASNKFVR